VYPPLLGRRACRPKVVRIRGAWRKIAQRRKSNATGVEILDTLQKLAKSLS
jgi:hypothetical protein